MATLVLSAVGAAAGASIGGSVFGLSSVLLGRAIGATAGRLIDQSLLGAGSPAVETGKIDRFRLTTSAEGAAIKRVYGTQRIGGQVIWASRFLESSTTQGGGKGTSRPKVTEYSYSVSLAVALCEGPIARVGRIWADGTEIDQSQFEIRTYLGGEEQLPDAKIQAVEGAAKVPAYRGLAYVVFEDLPLAPFGNRVPQFSFEVVRNQSVEGTAPGEFSDQIRATAIVPGSGEYALATTPLYYDDGLGVSRTANVHTGGATSDFEVSMDAMAEELPSCEAASLVVSWFGDDLRCGQCQIQPKVEQGTKNAVGMPWRSGGLTRAEAALVPRVDDRPIYGGTPADQSVVEAIASLRARGKAVLFYPFILMDQLDGNTLPNPWNDDLGQPNLPWRGRITTAIAPGRAGTSDKTSAAEAEVNAFFGNAAVSDFLVSGTTISYSGPNEFSYRRFILHYAHLCAAAGGVDAFCVGSELRGLTRIRNGANEFPSVSHLRQLASDVRSILGSETKISYAADWSEYFGYHPQDGSGDVFFHLDPFWADPNVDFIGIDNYMPISDWRGTEGEADEAYGSIYNLAYLKSNIDGGEGFDWFYHAPEAAEIQLRTEIADGAYGEDWVFRYKDLVSWWSKPHFNRPSGVKESVSTDWAPRSKPIWFTELGAPAVDKATNEPNKFFDPKSSESALPRYSNGQRDDLIQMQYIRAHAEHWADETKNPVSPIYGAPMVAANRMFHWAWDARPYPAFPGSSQIWSDAANYDLGHWLNGRVTARSLASVVAEICERSDFKRYNTDELYGVLRGYVSERPMTGREEMQPLMLAFGFDASERSGEISFKSRPSNQKRDVDLDLTATHSEIASTVQKIRRDKSDTIGRVRLNFQKNDGDFSLGAVEAIFPDEVTFGISSTEIPIVLSEQEAQGIAERWLAETRVASESIRVALPPSFGEVHPGQTLELPELGAYRIDRVTRGETTLIDATSTESRIFIASDAISAESQSSYSAPVFPVFPVFLDLPLITGAEDPVSPAIAVAADPWPGSVDVYSSVSGSGSDFNYLQSVTTPSVIGETLNSLDLADPFRWDRGAPLKVRTSGGEMNSAEAEAVLTGANLAAIGSSGSDVWEIFQFQESVMVAPNEFELSNRLRGQFGTDALIPPVWPIGSQVVLLNASVAELRMPPNLRQISRTYRIGPSRRSFDDLSFVEEQRAFSGVGLRPYAPAHLSVARLSSGDLVSKWIRRTRIEGDIWDASDVPLGEVDERYLVRVNAGGQMVRENTVSSSQWTYLQAEQSADGVAGAFEISVAQISDRFGPGLFRKVNVNV